MSLILTTTSSVADRQIAAELGLVQGLDVRAPGIFKFIIATLRALGGGRIELYTEQVADARREALRRLLEAAVALQADAVVGVRFETVAFSPLITQVVVDGTAVRLHPAETPHRPPTNVPPANTPAK